MDITVYDQNMVAVGIIDEVESFLWVERFDSVGEFEIYSNFSFELLALLQQDYYLRIKESGRTQIIESIEIKTTSDSQNKIVVKGRTLESILDRRIILRQVLIDGNLQTGVQTLLNENAIASIYPERNFPTLVWLASTDAAITSLTLKAQYYSENLYTVIENLCQQNKIGFRVALDNSGNMAFNLYVGADRSYAQSTNPYVVFSPDFDNLIQSNFFYTKRYKKNYVLVSGDTRYLGADGLPVRTQVFATGEPSLVNMYRREMFVDASDVSKLNETTNVEIPTVDYTNQLIQRGKLELANNAEYTIFDGQVDLSHTYKYRTDFFLGDIIQLVDAYGHSSRVRISEITFSESLSGSSIYPTLTTV